MKRQTIATKLVVVFFAVLMLCITTSITAFAATSTSAYVSSDTEVSRGEEITFTVGINNGTGIQAIMIVPDYDPSAFELVGGSWTLTGGLMSDFSVSTGDGVIAFSSGISINNAVLNFTLKAKDNAALGTQNVSAEVIITDSNGNSTLTTSGSSVQIKCNHNYSNQDFTYIKSEATCTAPAVYYKSCVSCGEKGTETFESGTTIEHSYTRKVTTDTYKKSSASCTAKAVYYYCCATCDKAGTETYENGTTLAHTYTRQVIEDAYKVSDADCDSKAIYNYCCATCDAKGTTTFEYGSILGHTGGTSTCTVKAECTRCHQPYGDMLDHVYTDKDATATYLKSEATCTSKALYYKNCATCDKAGTATFEYGSTEPHSYTRKMTTDTYKKSSASCTAKAVYYYCCATCNAKGTTTFEYGTTLSHNYTRKVVTDTYKKSAATCTDAAVYYYCCATCDAKGTTTYTNSNELGHTGGTSTCTAKAECTRCHQLYGSMLEHVYTDENATDTYLKSAATCTSKAVYYKNCATCDKAGTATFEYGTVKAHSYIEKVEDAYLKEGATCTSEAVYYKSCSTCGVKGTETFEVGDAPSHNYQTTWSSDETSHWHECSKCGDKKDISSHTAGAAATESTAQTCTVCGYVITPALGHTHNYGSEWLSNATEHWHKCGGCSSTKDNVPHDYTNACDTDCNTCGYTREITHSYKTEWSSNEEQHWYDCSVCGDKTSEANHIPGAEATETTDQVCTVCNFVIQEALGHTHNYNSSKNDETNHWKECACGEKSDVAAHTPGEWIIDKEAEVGVEGSKHKECTECKQVVEEAVIDAIPAVTEPDSKEQTEDQTNTPTEPDDPEGFSRWIVAVIAAVVVVGGGMAAILIILKKKKS